MATRIGIIGTGGMLPYHLKGFRAAGAEIVGIAGINLPQAQAAAARHDIPQAYGSTAELLKDARKMDAVSLIVPNALHAPFALDALAAGLHVFCEKPPALNATETAMMAEAARAAGRHLQFNFNNRARPEARALKQLIASGQAGAINTAQARWVRRQGIPGFGGWFTTKQLAGGGAQIDLLHMLDLALHFLGYPEPLNVLGKTFTNFANDSRFKGPWGIADSPNGVNDVETAAHAFITFKNGAALFLQTSWAELVEREQVSVTFQGTKLGAEMCRLFGTDGIDETATDSCRTFEVSAEGVTRTSALTFPACPDMGRSASAENFVQAIAGRAEPLNRPDEAVRLMRIVDAIYASSSTDLSIRLS